MITLNHSLIRDNSANGLFMDATLFFTTAQRVNLDHCVLYNNNRSGVRADYGVASISNSVIVSSGCESYGYYAPTVTNIFGNYNAFHNLDDGLMGYIESEGKNFDTRSAWFETTGHEASSLEGDPLFADPDGANYHLQTTVENGRYITGQGLTGEDASDSPLIDAGAPMDDPSAETGANGSRVNIGLYGASAEASIGPSASRVKAASMQAGGWMVGDGTFHWLAYGSATADTVSVSLSVDGGQNWSTLTTGVAAADEEIVWDSTSTNDTPAAVWRVRLEGNTNIVDETTNYFSIRNSALTLYVNDADSSGDVYATSTGTAHQVQASQAAPISSLQEALDKFDLEPGDTIFVDAGLYTGVAESRFSRADSGSSNSFVRITGSTNGPASLSELNPGTGTGSGLYVDCADYISMSNLVVQNVGTGLRIEGALSIHVGELTTKNNTQDGIYTDDSSLLRFSHVRASENTQQGMQFVDSTDVTVVSSVIWSNQVDALYLSNASVGMTGTVAMAHNSGVYVLRLENNSTLKSDYNDLYRPGLLARMASNNGELNATLNSWQKGSSNDLHSLTHDPLFADPLNDDFHVASEEGRYDAAVTGFVNDAETSLLVDTDNPLASVGSETEPNGARRNMGLYGGEIEASRSRTNGWLAALSLNDGGFVRGTNDLYWVVGGIATGHTVTIQASLDLGATWSNITAGVTATDGVISWDTVPFGTAPQVLWRVISDVSTSIVDQTDTTFVLNNGPLTYYVNDASTNLDVYTTAPGSPLNSGTVSNAPLPSIQDILALYDLKQGDMVLVDTGDYGLSADLVMDDAINGVLTNPVTIVGSPTTESRIFSLSGLRSVILTNTAHVQLKNLHLETGNNGVLAVLTTNCLFENVTASDNRVGFQTLNSLNITMRNCVAVNNDTGLYQRVTTSGSSDWQQGVLYSNRFGVSLSGGTLKVRNTFIGAFSSGTYAYFYDSGSLDTEYNSIFLANGAFAAFEENTEEIHENVSRWVRDFGQDEHSLRNHSVDFVDSDQGDFHPQSQGSHYTSGGFVQDLVTSTLVDTGDPSSDFSQETLPNGGQINIGAFGGTDQASRTPSTNGQLIAISFNDGGIADQALQPLYWAAVGLATNFSVTLEYSLDAGGSWIALTNNIPATNEVYMWDITAVTSSVRAAWRVRDSSGPTSDSTDELFALRNNALNNGQIDFFVNDANTNADVYAIASGAVTNTGDRSDSPKTKSTKHSGHISASSRG